MDGKWAVLGFRNLFLSLSAILNPPLHLWCKAQISAVFLQFMWKCRDRYIDGVWEGERKTEMKREGEAEWECGGAWEKERERERWKAECLLLPAALDNPKALSQLPVPLWTGLHPKHVRAFIGTHGLHATVVHPCKSTGVCVCVSVSPSKGGSEGVSQRWEDREAHWKACVVRWWRRAARTGRHAGTHAVKLGRGLIDLLRSHCCCKSRTHLRQMDGEWVRGYH